MPLRTAIRQNRILTFAVLLVGAWTVLSWLHVLSISQSFVSGTVPIASPGTLVGQVWVSGLVGLLVMLVFLGLLVVLWGELGELDPLPDSFPPEE